MSEVRPGLAALWMVGAMVSFTAMAVAGRYTALELSTFELMMYRSLIGLVVVLVVASSFGTLGEINTDRFGLHVLRNLFHFTGQNLWFFAVPLIPLAQLISLEFTVPVWVILLAPIFIGETLTRTKLIAAGLGFAGILIVARPEVGSLSPGLIAAATCAIGFAGAMMCTKVLTRTATVTCILFWLVALQSVFGAVIVFWDGEVAIPSMSVFPWVLVVSFGGLLAHLSITKALTLAPASLVGPLDFLRLPLIVVVGMVMFGEPFDPIVMIGAAFIRSVFLLN